MLKVFGGIVAGYVVFNTLCLAAVGITRCMEAEMEVWDESPSLAALASNGVDKVTDEAADTVKRWAKWLGE